MQSKIGWLESGLFLLMTIDVENLLQLRIKKLCNWAKTKQVVSSNNNHHKCQKPLTTWNKKVS